MSSRIAPIYCRLQSPHAVPLWAASLTGPAENWAAKVAAAEQKRDARIREVRAIRRYVLHNPRWKTDAVMTAMMSYDISGQKRYEVLDVRAEGIQKQVFQRILDGEVEIRGSERRRWIDQSRKLRHRAHRRGIAGRAPLHGGPIEAAPEIQDAPGRQGVDRLAEFAPFGSKGVRRRASVFGSANRTLFRIFARSATSGFHPGIRRWPT